MKKWLAKQLWSEEGDKSKSFDKKMCSGLHNKDHDNADRSQTSPNTNEGLESAGNKGSVDKSEAPLVNGTVTSGKWCRQLLPDVDKPATGPQVLAGVTTAATHLGLGCMFGFCGVTLPQLTRPPPGDVHMNDFHAALFSSVISVGAAVGSAATAVPQVWLGQRVTLLLALPVALSAWVALAASPNVWGVIAARVVQGLTLGFISGPSNNYVAELAHANLRGLLVGILNTSEQLGYLLVYAVGSSDLSWRQVALVCGFLTTVVPFLGLLLLPDSPRWLAARHRLLDAHRSLIFFRGPHYDSHAELVDITDQLALGKISARDQLEEMKDPNIINIVLLLTFLLLTSQFTGNFLVTTFEVPICNSTVVGMSQGSGAAITGTLRFFGSVFYLIVVERVGRKSLLIAAFLVCAGAWAMLGSYFYDQATADDDTSLEWLPLASLSVFSFFTNVGFSVVNVLRGEILPTSVRSTAVAFLYSLFYMGAFVASQTYFSVVGSVGKHGAFWLYCFFNLLMTVAGGLSLPETRGRSLEKITAKDQNRGTRHSYDHCSSTQRTFDCLKVTRPTHNHSNYIHHPQNHHKCTRSTHHHSDTTGSVSGSLRSKQPAQCYLMSTRHLTGYCDPRQAVHNLSKSPQTAQSYL